MAHIIIRKDDGTEMDLGEFKKLEKLVRKYNLIIKAVFLVYKAVEAIKGVFKCRT